MDMKKITLFVSILFFTVVIFTGASDCEKDYRDDGLRVTEDVERFVQEHHIEGSEIEKVCRIIKLMHDPFLFVKIDRRRMGSWIEDPKKLEEFKKQIEEMKPTLETLYKKRTQTLLSEEEHKKLRELQKSVFLGEHDLKVFEELVSKKDICHEDLPFAISGAEAVKYKISDGCTTATKTFMVLAKAAGIQDLRFVATGNVPDYDTACISQGKARKRR